jgi:2-polyprenyl-3-methyl-5-hydroxy-6-metoxy-1,4-benzoquinol methylase
MIEFIKQRVIREDFILKSVIGKNVLDIGCVAANGLMELHKKISEFASSCIGLDVVAADGVIVGDAQDFAFNEPFDIIIAGEIIEHIADLRGFLACSARNLRVGGRLILTTPNAYSLISLKSAVFGRKVPNDPNHVLLFDPTTLINLFRNHANGQFSGKCYYYEEKNPQPIIYRINKFISKAVIGFSCGILLDLTRENDVFLILQAAEQHPRPQFL